MSNLPVTFVDRVRAKISENIGDLIPEAELSRLVSEAVSHFQAKELPQLIKNEIHAQLQISIRAEFAKPEYQPVWEQYGGYGASTAVKRLIEENAGTMLQGLIGAMCQNVVSQMTRSY